MTYRQRRALTRIRVLERRLIDRLSVWDAPQCEALLAEIEGLIATHFPEARPLAA